jgi:hypothetical protein
MNGRKNKSTKAFAIMIVSLIGWFVVTTTIANWWAVITRAESAMGTTEFFIHEMVKNAPHFVYFLLVGSIFAVVLDKKAGVQWALLTAAIAMCIYAFMSHNIFYQDITFLDIGILLNYYALPLAFAVGGALAAQTIAARKEVK